jgi:hypothetical protein
MPLETYPRKADRGFKDSAGLADFDGWDDLCGRLGNHVFTPSRVPG